MKIRFWQFRACSSNRCKMTTLFTEFNHHSLCHCTYNFTVQEISSLHQQLQPLRQGIKLRMFSQWFQPCGVWWAWYFSTTTASGLSRMWSRITTGTRDPRRDSQVSSNAYSVISAGNCYTYQTRVRWTCVTVNSNLALRYWLNSTLRLSTDHIHHGICQTWRLHTIRWRPVEELVSVVGFSIPVLLTRWVRLVSRILIPSGDSLMEKITWKTQVSTGCEDVWWVSGNTYRPHRRAS